MIKAEEMQKLVGKNPRIVTLGTHSSLQILKGAKDEGFRTAVIAIKGREEPYKRFPNLADEIIMVDQIEELLDAKVQDRLRNDIFIPHASLIEYLGWKSLETDFALPIFGNRQIFKWEGERHLQNKWLKEAGVRVPREYLPEELKGICIVKRAGAKGGRGYFIVKSKEEFLGRVQAENLNMEELTIQEYILGATVYPHYFYSPLSKENELMSIDRRYESNVDGVGRLMTQLFTPPTYVVIGNLPLVLRESLLPSIFSLGDKIAEASRRLFSPGLIGPYCVETICTDHLEFVTFEISARIVAGTNLYIDGSPYTDLRYDCPMSTGRRIARELKKALATGLDLVIS